MSMLENIGEEDYQSESDARVLADAKAIMADKNRLLKAKKAAKKIAPMMADDAKVQTARAKAMERLAKAKK